MKNPPKAFYERLSNLSGREVWSRYYRSLDEAQRAATLDNASPPVETTPGQIWRVDSAIAV